MTLVEVSLTEELIQTKNGGELAQTFSLDSLTTVMIQLDSLSDTSLETLTITKVAPVTSRVSPWLAPLVYFLGVALYRCF